MVEISLNGTVYDFPVDHNTNCRSLNDEPCSVRPNLTDLNPNDYLNPP